MNERLQESLKLYIEETDRILEHMHKAWDMEDIKTVQSCAHSLKSSSGVLGAIKLSTLLEHLDEQSRIALEKAAGVNDINDSLFIEINDVWEELKLALEERIKSDVENVAAE